MILSLEQLHLVSLSCLLEYMYNVHVSTRNVYMISFLPSEVVKKEKLSSFHVHRSNWVISIIFKQPNNGWSTGYHSLGNLCDGPDSRQTGDLILQAVDEDGDTLREFLCESVADRGHHLSHASDGTLLHLLIDVSCLETLQGRVVNGKNIRMVVKWRCSIWKCVCVQCFS